MTWRSGLAIVLLGAGCGFSIGPNHDVVGDAPLADSAPVPDAGTCQGASITCAGDNTVRTCSGPGVQATDETCTWSCIDGAPNTAHCGAFSPSGGAVLAGDLLPNPQLDVDVAATVDVTIDTNSGAISGGIVRGPITGFSAGIGYQLRNNVAVFTLKSLHVRNVVVGGDHALAFAAAGDIVIDGVLDLRGAPLCSGTKAGPGGNNGGSGGTQDGNGGGNNQGGGGGARGGNGGDGGGNAGSGGTKLGDDLISTLIGGGGGGSGGGGGGGAGGGGGGAIQLVSNTAVKIVTGAGINAGGCGGSGGGGGGKDSGGGGGAGGAILIEAPSVAIGGTLAANGGGGGGGKNASPGQPGGLGAMQAAGGATAGTSRGGDGGAGTTVDGGNGQASTNSGGGGGGVGKIRLNVRPRTTPVTLGATISPPLGAAGTPATAGFANVK